MGLMMLVLVVACAVLARRHVRSGRGDRRGALRLALFVVLIVAANVLISAGHTMNLQTEFDLLLAEIGMALSFGLLTWLAYLAVEPYMRRYWPETLVSWNRLLAGRFTDPLVGTHLLVGCAVGTLLAALLSIRRLIPGWLGMEATWPPHPGPGAFKGPWALLANLLALLGYEILFTLSILLMLSLLLLLLRKKWIAIAAVVLVWAVTRSIGIYSVSYFPVYLIGELILIGGIVLLLTRFGPVAAIPAAFIELAPFNLLLTLDFSTWLANGALLSLALLSALMIYAYRISLGRPGVAAVKYEGR
jgi:serine/threonine-protein kinase